MNSVVRLYVLLEGRGDAISIFRLAFEAERDRKRAGSTSKKGKMAAYQR